MSILEQNYNSFMKKDISSYTGEWIAILDGVILAHGRNVTKVAEEAAEIAKGKKFLLARVPSEETMVF